MAALCSFDMSQTKTKYNRHDKSRVFDPFFPWLLLYFAAVSLVIVNIMWNVWKRTTHTSTSDRAMKAHKSRLSVNLCSCKQTTTTKHRLLFNQYTQSSHTQCTICTINSRNEHTPKRKGNKKYNQYSSFLYKNHIFNFYVTVHFVVGWWFWCIGEWTKGANKAIKCEMNVVQWMRATEKRNFHL